MKTRKKLSAVTAMAAVALTAIALTGCSSGGGGGAGGANNSVPKTDTGGKITVWVDAPRVPAADAFKKAHPEIPINIVQIDSTVGATTTQQHFAQFDAAKKAGLTRSSSRRMTTSHGRPRPVTPRT